MSAREAGRALGAAGAALSAALLLSGVARAELPAPETPAGRSMMERFKGVAVDRCKDVGGPPVAAKEGPAIARLGAGEGRPGQIVTVFPAAAADPAHPDEVRFLLRGKELRAEVAADRSNGLKVPVPDFGVQGPSKGWVHLVRNGAVGRAVPFLFREKEAATPPRK